MKVVAFLAVALALFSVVSSQTSDAVAIADEADDTEFLQFEDELALQDEAADEAEEEDEDEEDVESEEDADEEADEESFAETESDSDSDSETESNVDAVAMGVTENQRGGWNLYSNVFKEKAHEAITIAANKQGINLDEKSLVNGVRWNDMPEGAIGDPKKGIDETEEAKMIKEGHLDIDTFLRIFKLTHTPDDLVFATHYGCLQFWHSMSPVQRQQSTLKADTRLVFTNRDVKGLILAQMQQWWSRGVTLANKGNKNGATWYWGHILHSIQDSFARGHAFRTTTSSDCGKVVMFQGYDCQNSDVHGKADYSPNSGSRDKNDAMLNKRWNCAIDYTKYVLTAMKACITTKSCAWAPIRSWLDKTVYSLSNPNNLAGGTHPDFAAKDVVAKGFKQEKIQNINFWVPKSTNNWSKARGTVLCGGTRPIQSKCVTGFGVYKEKDFFGYKEFTAPSTN